MQQRSRQCNSLRIALRGQRGQRRAARIPQSEQLGGLVERLAGGVVDCLAQHLVAPHAVHPHQLRVAAGHQQRDERELRWIGRQERRHQVAFQVVHAQRRLAERGRQRARDARAHQERAGQAGPARERDDVDVALRQRRIGQRRLEQRQHTPDVVARRQLRHHPAVGLVHADLAVQRLRAQAGKFAADCFDQRHAGFVARRFDAKNDHETV